MFVVCSTVFIVAARPSLLFVLDRDSFLDLYMCAYDPGFSSGCVGGCEGEGGWMLGGYRGRGDDIVRQNDYIRPES